jgi:transposase-like protein
MKAKLASAPDSKEPLLSGPKIARSLDIDPATVRRWRKEKAPHHLIGKGLIRYRLSEILAWRAKR